MRTKLFRVWDNLLGHGEAAVTVPPLDGAFQPNHTLDKTLSRFPLEAVDCLVALKGVLYATSGNAIHKLEDGIGWNRYRQFCDDIACIAPTDEGGLVVAFDTGDIYIEGGKYDGSSYRLGDGYNCITALAISATEIFVAHGSENNASKEWQRDLLERRTSGGIWRINILSGEKNLLAGDLAYPSGLVLDGDVLVVSEAWQHQIVRISLRDPNFRETLYSDLPGYPGRITAAKEGYWLAVFAPRSQLVEYVLREKKYRNRMMSEISPACWISPKLRSGRHFYEPLQGGGVKQLGVLKPWAPTMSSGLCVRLNKKFQPVFALHSRADGYTHGVTDMKEINGNLFVAARGDGVVVSISHQDFGGEG